MPVVKYRTDKKRAGGHEWWSDKQKLETVATYLLVGNMAQVSRLSGIPHITLRKWKAQPWWSEAEQEVKRSSKIELSGKLKKAIELANLAIEDRLVNGEFVFNQKTGEVVRRPVSADTAVKVFDKLVDKQLLLEKQADLNNYTTQEGITERLAKIAEELLKFQLAKDVTPQSGQPLADPLDVTPPKPLLEVIDVRETSGVRPPSAGLHSEDPGLL